MEKLLIIDGNSLINRAFYALPLLNNQFGEYSNAVYGFTNILTKAILEYKPNYIAVAFDYGKKTFRNEIYQDYKANRKGMPEELAMQMPILKNLLELMNIKYFEKSGIEADDIIGTIAAKSGVENIILSGDRDLFQLINKNTTVYFTKKGVSEIEAVNEPELKNLMGLKPYQIVEYKALRGDPSDNIPGVLGIGEKTALSLLTEYDNVENIYKNLDNLTASVKTKLETGKEMAQVSKQLATINTNANISFELKSLSYDFPYNNSVYEFFKKYEFNSLMRRKDIFSGIENQTESIDFERIEIKDEKQLKDVISYIKEEQRIAFDFSKDFVFATSANFEYKFSSEITLFSDSISLETGLIALKPLFEDENILKICFDLKKHKHLLDKFNINIAGDCFDLSIAKYVLNLNAKINESSPTQYFYEYKTLNEQMEKYDVKKLFDKIEMPLVDVLYNMENYGLLIDQNSLEETKLVLSNEIENLTNQIYSLAGEEFKLNSPKALSEILFDKLNLPTNNNKKRSTNVEVLTEIEEEHEIIPLILKYRKLQKLLSSYVEPFSEIASANDGYINTTFNQTQTSTGRLASSDPNLQNLPIRDEEGKHLRKLFISRFKNGQMVSADYNQIELRLMAHFSQDENLIDAYKKGADIHAATASLIFDKPMSEISANERRMAKAVNFGIIYGISDYGLSQNLHTSVVKAKSYIDRYFYTFPGVKNYIEKAVEDARKNGFATTLFGRKRTIPELNSTNKATQKFGERVAMNMPLQGTASDIIKIAMVNVFNEIKKQNLQSKLVLQIHDELVVDCKEDEVDKIKIILKNCMTNVISLSIPLPVAIESGKTLMECK